MFKNEYIYISSKNIPVKLSNGTNIHENIFIYDNNKNFIQKSSFLCDMNFNLDINFTKENILINEPSFLFYTNSQEKAFGHYMFELINKIYFILQNENVFKNTKILIPDMYNFESIQKILQYIKLDKNIVLLKNNTLYKCNNLMRIKQSTDFRNLNNSSICCINLIKKLLNIKENKNPYKKLYLKRNSSNNNSTGLYNIGKYRSIINELKLIDYLRSQEFEIVEVGNLTITDKSNLLTDVNILITPLGGNCFNLLFSNTPKNILFLSNEHEISFEFIKNILRSNEILNNTETNISIHKSKTIYNLDPENCTNGSYEVDINNVSNFIKSCS